MKNRKSQSLIEVMVAIGILFNAIISIISMAYYTLQLSGQGMEAVISSALAREGMEVVYAIYGGNLLNSDQVWPYGLATNGNYVVQYDTTALSTAADNSTLSDCANCQLCVSETTGIYINYSSGCPGGYVLTPLRRMITIADGDSNSICVDSYCTGGAQVEKKITSYVYWQRHGRPYTARVEARLTNWHR